LILAKRPRRYAAGVLFADVGEGEKEKGREKEEGKEGEEERKREEREKEGEGEEGDVTDPLGVNDPAARSDFLDVSESHVLFSSSVGIETAAGEPQVASPRLTSGATGPVRRTPMTQSVRHRTPELARAGISRVPVVQ
jgi:hypothetical protein